MKAILAIACALLMTSVVMVPLATANVAVCVSLACSQVSTSSETQVWTCGGSGNVIVITGDHNDVDICNGNNTRSETSLM